MSRTPAVAIRRVLVAVDASPASLAAAATAAELAVVLEAELTGLFIEETALLELAGSPLARQLSALTAEADRLDRAQLERQLRAQAGRARRDFGRLAERSGVRSSFRVVRGQVAEQIVAEAGDADLVSLGRVGWSLRHRRVLGSAARALLAQERRRALLVERSRRRAAATPTSAPPLAIYDGSPAGGDAVELALQLAAPAGQRITVLLMGEEPAALRQQLQTRLGPRMQTVGVTLAVEPTPEGVRRAVGRHRPGLLVVPIGSGPHGEELIQQLLEETGGPLLAVT